MISPILPSHDADTVSLRVDLLIAQMAYDYRVSQSAIATAIVEHLLITPSRPASHAPAAQTDGEALPPPSTSPIRRPFTGLRELAQREAMPDQTAECAPDHGSSAMAAPKETASDEGESNSRPPARRRASTDSRDGALANGLGTTQRGDGAPPALSSEPPSETGKLVEPKGSAAPPSLRDRIAACHADHPDWPAKLIAEHCGTSEDQVRAAASRRKLRLVSWWDYLRAQKGKTTDALKAAAEPVEPTEPPQAPRPPEPPPAARHEPARRPPEHDADGVLHRVKKAPAGRFYLREKTALGKESRFVHQSLVACPTGPGPLMTSDRKWAWYDTMERYRGAVKKWPELASMRKVAAEK